MRPPSTRPTVASRRDRWLDVQDQNRPAGVTLGVTRQPLSGSGFRGYADYMQTEAFREHLDACLAAVRLEPVAIMCAEAVPWRCHRQLIADAAVARGWRVLHILSPARADAHALSPDARVRADGTLVYPGNGADQPELDYKDRKICQSCATEVGALTAGEIRLDRLRQGIAE